MSVVESLFSARAGFVLVEKIEKIVVLDFEAAEMDLGSLEVEDDFVSEGGCEHIFEK